MTETQAWAFLVLGVFSAAIALLSVVSFRRVAARRATLDFLRRYTAAPEVARGIKILRANSPDKFIPLEGENRENLLFLLNMFESLAIGLDSGIYDKRMVIQSFGRDLKVVWERAEPFIQHIRDTEKDPDAFTQFENLAKRTQSETRTRIR